MAKSAWANSGRPPIHFPLEGSTHDVDLSYFDLLAERFPETAAAGGHVIVGTHPDLVRNVYSISTVCRWNQKLDGATPGRG